MFLCTSRVQVLSAVQFGFAFFRKSRFRGFRSLRSEKSAKWIGIFPKKSRDEKTGEISRNLPFSRRLARQTAVFIVRIDFDHTTWQGQEDSNLRPTVLESIWGNASPPERSLFRNFSGVWKPCLRTAILIDTFLMLWKYFSAIAGSQNSHNFPIGWVLLQAPIITKYAAPDDL